MVELWAASRAVSQRGECNWVALSPAQPNPCCLAPCAALGWLCLLHLPHETVVRQLAPETTDGVSGLDGYAACSQGAQIPCTDSLKRAPSLHEARTGPSKLRPTFHSSRMPSRNVPGKPCAYSWHLLGPQGLRSTGTGGAVCQATANCSGPEILCLWANYAMLPDGHSGEGVGVRSNPQCP